MEGFRGSRRGPTGGPIWDYICGPICGPIWSLIWGIICSTLVVLLGVLLKSYWGGGYWALFEGSIGLLGGLSGVQLGDSNVSY